MKRHSMRWGADGKLPDDTRTTPDKVVPEKVVPPAPKVETNKPVVEQQEEEPKPASPVEPDSFNYSADNKHGLSTIPV